MARSVESKVPTRRSTRQTSVQPSRTSTPEPTSSKSGKTTTKRKRTAKEELEQEEQDVEIVQEEPRKPNRKPSSRQASTSARSVSGRKARVPEPVEETPEDKPSPPKKSKHVDSDEEGVEDTDAALISKGKRSTRKPRSRSTKLKRVETDSDDAIEVTDNDAHESSEDEKPKRRGKSTKPPSKASAPARGKTKAAAAKKVVVDTDDEEEEVDDMFLDDSKQTKEDRFSAIPESRSSSAEVEEQVTPRANRVRPVKQEAAPAAPSRMSIVSVVEEDEEQEQEKSLLEPTPPPQKPLAVPTPIPEVEEPKGSKSRLVIHKMVLINFKSYAGKQVIGPFHKSFSAIVGPNGSGKSNTIDALLFVFGYRASKMRQGKLSELIHNSANYPDLDECSVEVHFREIIDLPGPDAFEVVSDSQLVVARIAYKNNASKYTINERSSTFTEVTTLLKGRGIDLDHKRFLILQGEVESIAQMKPKAPTEHEDGLLEYLEDIIGTSKYKTPIDEALVELDALAEARAEKLNRLRIVEREKNALEEKKREAEDFLRLQNDHVKAQSRLYQWNLWKCFQAEQQYNANIEEYEHELEEEREHNKDDIEHCKQLEQHYKDREEAYEEVKRAATAAKKELAENEKQLVNLEERKKHENSKQKKLTKSLQEDKKVRDEAKRSIEENTEKMVKNKKKLAEFEESLAEEEKLLEKIRDSLKDKTQVFHDQIEVKQKELQPWTAKINAKQAEIDVAVSERDTLAKKAEAIKATYAEAQDALERLQGDHEAKNAERHELHKSLMKLQKEAKESEKKLRDMEKHIHELRSRASSSRQKVDEAKASQAASTSQNKVLDSLTRLSQTGRISGFHGRLGSLGTIPEKYDVAVSTAAPALNNLIVDEVEQGQLCIEYLRKQSVGRASFIVLEKLSQTNGLDKIVTPENVPRLFDLIKPKDPRFAPAFFKAVGNTLVANDLEQANRIAYGQRRWRVVTLTGQLIDTSGTMSGGGNHVARGAMSSKLAAEAVQPEVMKRYEKESEDAARQLASAQEELREYEGQMDGIARRIPQVQMELQKVELDIQTGDSRIAEAEKRVRDLRAQTKPDKGDLARISTLDAEIETSNAKLESLHEKAAVIEKAIKELEKKILEIGGAKLLTQRSKVDGIKLHINLAMEEITKAEVNKAKAEKDTVKHEKSLEANKEALNEVETELAKLNEEWEECSDFVNELQSRVDAAQHAADNAKDDLENLKSQLDEKTAQIQEFRAKEMEITQKLKDVRKEKTENDKLIKHYSQAHDNLKLEDIDDDDDEEDDTAGDDGEAKPADEAGGDAARVKEEPTDDVPPPKKRARTPSSELHVYTVEELSKFKKRELLADVTLLEEQVKNANPNLGVLKEYRKREQEFLNRAKDLEEVTARRDAQKAKYDGLRKQRLDEFMTGFSAISAKLKEMYQMITLGGNAELELVDSMDPFSEGIIFSVMPPKKSWKNISNLSGGEKTLSSLALVFALHVFKPTPLYFMDEIDAALDFRNVSIVANYIKDRTKNAQFIIISLRNDMFELSHRLIGIYKTSNATKSISINNHALRAKPVKVA